jgi:hypothetical protein
MSEATRVGYEILPAHSGQVFGLAIADFRLTQDNCDEILSLLRARPFLEFEVRIFISRLRHEGR